MNDWEISLDVLCTLGTSEGTGLSVTPQIICYPELCYRREEREWSIVPERDKERGLSILHVYGKKNWYTKEGGSSYWFSF